MAYLTYVSELQNSTGSSDVLSSPINVFRNFKQLGGRVDMLH